jgi:poly(beta-D-mannuronate) C5 epimerase
MAFASAATCPTTSTRFASSSNTLYADGAATVCTPGDLNAKFPNQVVKVANGVFLVRSNIKLTNGAKLDVAGTAVGGDTDELRLLSNNGSSTSFVSVTADWGSVSFRSTKVTSWNESANGPDTEYATGRAFVRVRSSYVSGVAHTSRMDVSNSDVGYLGYYASESYGMVWKVLGSAFSNVDVLGDITGSHLHNNYFGAYTYGAYGMNIDNNEFDHNVKYGLDPHDDSDSLKITNNKSHDNGDHGIICSQRCDHLLISGNQSYNNVGHGIMLHRSTDNNIVENNTVKNNTDTGIALFESNNNIIRNNYLEGNASSLRLSVGSSYNTFENNTIVSSKKYGVYTYKGSDTPARPGNDGVNRYNTFKGNVVSNSVSNILKLTSSDHDTYSSNDFRNNPSGFYLTGATNMTYTSNLVDAGKHLP